MKMFRHILAAIVLPIVGACLIAASAHAQTYNVFSPGCGLAGTWNSQHLVLGAGGTCVTGSLPVTNLNAGTSASSTTFWRGDGTWATPPGTGGGTVNSVAQTVPSGFSVAGSPITNSGTLAITYATGQAANNFLATPNGTTGALGLRVIVGGDLPAINLAASGAGGVTGNMPVTNLNSGTSASSTTFWRGDGTWVTPPGGVSSVALTAPSVFAVGGSPVTTTGTLALTFASGQTGNEVLASPNGTTGAVGLRALVGADLPAINLAASGAGGVTGNLPTTNLNSGTSASSTTFWRGDGVWATPAGAGPANPTTNIDLSTHNGAASTFMRSDAAPALSQSIAPTWTGNHTFTPASGVGVSINGVANSYSQVITGSATSGQSFGLSIRSGTTSADNPFAVLNAAASVSFLNVLGDGGLVLANPTGGDKGLGTLNATDLFKNNSLVPAVNQSPTWTGVHTWTGPASAIAINANAGAGGQAAQFSAPSGANGVLINAGSTSTDVVLRLFNSNATANYFEVFGDGHGFLTPPSGGLTWNTAGNFSFAAPSSGAAIATFASTTGDIITARDSGNSFQLSLGATSSFAYIDASNATLGLALTTQGSANTRLSISNAGNVTVNAPSSGTTLIASGSAIQFASKTTVARGSGTNWIDFQDPTGESAFIGFGNANNNFGVQNILNGALTLGTNNAVNATISSAGGLFMAGATGGDQGAGTINATGCFVNGSPCLTVNNNGSLASAGCNASGGFFGTSHGFTSCTNSSGLATFNYLATQAHALNCVASGFDAMSAGNTYFVAVTTSTTTQVTVNAYNAAGSNVSHNVVVMCN